MQVDFQTADEATRRRFVVTDEDGRELKDVAFADDDAGTVRFFVTRLRDLSDPKDADLRHRTADGTFVLREEKRVIRIVDLAVSPWKREFLDLLRDPDVQAELRSILR